jgi:hypothetical protein
VEVPRASCGTSRCGLDATMQPERAVQRPAEAQVGLARRTTSTGSLVSLRRLRLPAQSVVDALGRCARFTEDRFTHIANIQAGVPYACKRPIAVLRSRERAVRFPGNRDHSGGWPEGRGGAARAAFERRFTISKWIHRRTSAVGSLWSSRRSTHTPATGWRRWPTRQGRRRQGQLRVLLAPARWQADRGLQPRASSLPSPASLPT